MVTKFFSPLKRTLNLCAKNQNVFFCEYPIDNSARDTVQSEIAHSSAVWPHVLSYR